ncbi:sugar ABC transporter permease [Isoptericola variabilis]|uniref:ABC-type transporter, integral membrane subunit n=1 Tax=Isoptericola variabilis (strain 225) TaxID=743718 RepID=F6FQ47_ISOV2|nr:ABC transporter permease subunit [Isoptericola variabilis]AEG44853.1 ABC-type transporter, integral membrane subunit [Isoptericola variabilis 225]TWH31623.1 carbohydrate ABC transporter membrane protein 1 (CUT1 family) [Isoptericola variabilis J7]
MTTQSMAHQRAPVPRRGTSHLRRAGRSWQLYVLLAPALLYVVLFKYWPMYGAQIAFRNYNPADGFAGSPWVGLDHFERFVESFQFERLMVNTLSLNALGLLLAFPVPIVLALIVNQLQSDRFKKFTQTVLYSPSFISVVVVVGMIHLLFSPRAGIVNNAIEAFGGTPVFFMGSPEWFRPLYVGSDIWQNAGFSMIVYLAALTAIDPSLHEAARVDGANKWQRIRHIDIPGIMPVITILFILAIGNLFNLGFEKVLLMQTDLNLPTSEVIQTYVYKAGLQQAQFSYSAAIGVFNSLINLALLLTFNWVARRANQSSLW